MALPTYGRIPILLRPLPDAFILGAMRAGTTFLHDALQHHRDVARARHKELQYFSLHWADGPDRYRRQMPRRWPRWLYALGRYRRPLVVDATPYYLFHPEAPARLAATTGSAVKCIVLLRDPSIRAWSHYRMMLGLGWEHLGFRDALARESERCAAPIEGDRGADLPGHLLYSYVSRGFYARQLRAWWQHVPRSNFLLLRSEDMFRSPGRSFELVCDFLDLPRIELPDGLNRNSMVHPAMPRDIRLHLDEIFRVPNRDLLELTGIGWDAAPACGSGTCS